MFQVADEVHSVGFITEWKLQFNSPRALIYYRKMLADILDSQNEFLSQFI
jgi:hypothetical protein